MGCRDQTEGKISCTVAASLHPRAHPAHSYVLQSSLLEDMHALHSLISVDLFVFPTQRLHHSSRCHSFTPSSFVCSLNACHIPSSCLSHSFAVGKKHANASIYPPTHRVGMGESPASSTVWRGDMQGNTKKKKNGAAPLPNGVSMATKGARSCDAVSNKHRILNP